MYGEGVLVAFFGPTTRPIAIASLVAVETSSYRLSRDSGLERFRSTERQDDEGIRIWEEVR